MTTESNEEDDDLKAKDLQIALFQMRDDLTRLSLALKDYLFELDLAQRNSKSLVDYDSSSNNKNNE